MDSLNGAIDNACDRCGYTGAWGLLIESGARTGYHFHAWFPVAIGSDLEKAIARHWIKACRERDNSRKVFHSKPLDNPPAAAAYLAKIWSGGWRSKRVFDLWGREGQWKPFRFHPGALKAGSEKAAGNAPGCFSYQMDNHAKPGADTLPEADSSPPSASAAGAHVHLLHRDRHGTEKEGQNPVQSFARIGVRTMPRYGPGDALISLNSEEVAKIAAHFQRLATRWNVESVAPAGPPWPLDCVEVTFLIPAGQVSEFERVAAAPLRGLGRIFRR